ncbi:MAG: ABC transporter ATP-binding protein, partial [Myxococcales bacterium]|nr:ABC transporter ATP-binding protein [Myxococcales bacterium]
MDTFDGIALDDEGAGDAGPAPDRTVSAFALLRRTVVYARPYLPLLLSATGFALLFTLGRNGRAYLLKPLLDDVIPSGDFAAFLRLTLIALGLVLIMPVSLFGRTFLTKLALGRILLDIRTELTAKLLRLPLTRHHSVNTGDTLTRTMMDAAQAQRANRLVFYELLQSFISVIGGFATMLFLSWKLMLLSLLSLPLMALVLGFFARRIRKKAAVRQQKLSEVTQRLANILSGIKVIKAFRGEALERDSFHAAARRFYQKQMKVVLQGTLSRSTIELLNSGTGIGIVFVGGYLVMNDIWGLTVGGLSAFVLAAAMTYAPIKKVSESWPELMDALASTERFFEILDEPEEAADRPDAVAIGPMQREIVFDHVSFGYRGRRVIHDVSFSARRGEVVALVGPTGAGKTTLADLLLRFYDPDEGAIRIDGVDLRDATRDSYLDQIAVVTQEPFLFDTSIRENIRYARPGADEAAFEAAVRTAHVDEFADKLPERYETPVGEFGVMLSGGQRQRITIARALMKDPSVLVFDEATSALDAKTERIVQDALDALRGRRTVFVIAHRLSTIRRADRILVLEGGRIVQQGTHDELVAREGLYRELVSLQAE